MEHGLEAVQPVVYAKFQQNDILEKSLSTTKPRTIAEATRDTIWGTGIHFTNKVALNEEQWNSKGWMNKLLTEIRDNT